MSKVFDAYAAYYDLLYKDKSYTAEAEYVAGHIQRYVPQATRILELGCGTGGHAEYLARMGYTIHGVDLSESMLAKANARRAGFPPEVQERLLFIQGDVRTVRTGETYDAVISLFHVISYQTTNADLIAAMTTAATHLKPGGVFIFDCWYGPGVFTDPPETRVRRLEGDGFTVTRIAKPEHHFNKNLVDVHYEILVEGSQGLERIHEVHSMRYLFAPEVDLLLQAAGLRRLVLKTWMEEGEPGLKSWNVCFVATR